MVLVLMLVGPVTGKGYIDKNDKQNLWVLDGIVL